MKENIIGREQETICLKNKEMPYQTSEKNNTDKLNLAVLFF